MKNKSIKLILSKIYTDVIHDFILAHKTKVRLIVFIMVLGVILSALAPIAIAKVIEAISSAYSQGTEATYYIAAFILLRFLGQAVIDLRWVVVNSVLYSATYIYCTSIVERITGTYKINNGFSESASEVSERTAILSKMQIGLMSVLHGLVVVIFPAIIEILIVMAIVYTIIGASFIAYFLIGAFVLYIATGIGRTKEIQYGHSSYDADNEVLAYCGDILANSKMNREMQASRFFKYRLSRLIEKSLNEYKILFLHKYKRASYLTLSICVAYMLVFAWAGWLITLDAISASQLFLLVVYLERVLTPITGASAAINNIQHGLISISAGYELLDDLVQRSAQEQFTVDKAAWSRVVLTHETTYAQKADVLLIGIGRRIRLVGPSGAGKSTYLRRVYKKIIDAEAVAQHDVHYLSAQVEWVKGSVFENIALGCPAIHPSTVQQTLDLWSNHFGNRALKTDDSIDELSAGERQWLAIVRSLLRKPRILFMDEATNSLDVQTEPLVWAHILSSIPINTTLFVVTHKPICPIPVDHEVVLPNWRSHGSAQHDLT
ncbi:ATP-binding cassette domain-containing protein [Pseudomonas akapageensis]|uniref:ATP-binding cassette domain-containing protein n=1 Tax=Pseudomonas akapageensis TaxID=2609961 RepID=UPI00140961A7|nr:ABC transporter ATP-binding protein [Pseudomonas akapageensis]